MNMVSVHLVEESKYEVLLDVTVLKVYSFPRRLTFHAYFGASSFPLPLWSEPSGNKPKLATYRDHFGMWLLHLTY